MQSEPGAGSTFTFTVPIGDGPAASALAAESEVHSMKLLIIDDEAHIRLMMRLTLEAAGYQVDEAATGEEGLALFGDGAATPRSCSTRRCRGSTGCRRCGS